MAAEIPAMTSEAERAMFRRLALECAHKGNIVELGAWLGAGTAAIADGIRQSGARNVVHSYDRFKWNAAQHAAKAGGKHFDRMFAAYQANLGPLLAFVAPHKGEIEASTWSGPISLLVADGPKRIKPVQHVLSEFGPWLMPASVMAWQDFCFAPAYAIAACLYRLRDHFTFREAADFTVVFNIKEPWSRADASLDRLALERWTVLEVFDALDYWQSVLPHEAYCGASAGAALMLSDLGHGVQARGLAHGMPDAGKQRLRKLWTTHRRLRSRYSQIFERLNCQ